MNRSFLIIVLPAVAVAIGYVLVLRWLGYDLEPFRFVVAGLVAVAAVIVDFSGNTSAVKRRAGANKRTLEYVVCSGRIRSRRTLDRGRTPMVFSHRLIPARKKKRPR